MLFNFHKLPKSMNVPLNLFFLFLIWLVIFKNYFFMPKPHPCDKETGQKNTNIPYYDIFHALKILNLTGCLIHKIDIYPHEFLIFGHVLDEQAFSSLEVKLKKNPWVKHVEVKQWDFQKTGKWRFVIGVGY